MRFLLVLIAILLPVEALAQTPDFRVAYFNRLDQRKTGGFTLQDLQRISAKEFKRIDDNKDGGLSLDEYTFGIPSSRQDAIDFFTARFKRSDYNGDGKVDFTEDQAYCVDLVNLADSNKDGIVTRDEFLTAVAQ
ncbi:EF-hand domain-containing protein [Dongia rigui]|uniref:EF-hand domain-containing protein n=1 Tax=Dongia rigui TaxID=940149 RepID=A0ABU5DS72_9PROT|nr:EF-hand domain-containing protein [Dongia rigui]MDY0870284.1 EF-hand domain-containing protein [Dongia rigui]